MLAHWPLFRCGPKRDAQGFNHSWAGCGAGMQRQRDEQWEAQSSSSSSSSRPRPRLRRLAPSGFVVLVVLVVLVVFVVPPPRRPRHPVGSSAPGSSASRCPRRRRCSSRRPLPDQRLRVDLCTVSSVGRHPVRRPNPLGSVPGRRSPRAAKIDRSVRRFTELVSKRRRLFRAHEFFQVGRSWSDAC
jgi:hypothetical protein